MKVPMCRITIYGIQKHRKAILEFLQRKRILDISAHDAEDGDFGFFQMDTSDSQSEFLRERNLGERALSVLEQYVPEPHGMLSSYHGRKSLSASAYQKFVEDIPEMRRIAERLTELSEEIAEKQGQILHHQTKMEELQAWLSLDVSADSTGTKTTSCFIGSFPESISAQTILERYYTADAPPPVFAEVLHQVPRQTCVWFLCRKEQAIACEKRLREIGFSRPKTAYQGVPREETERLSRQISALEEDIAALKKEICSYQGARNALKFMADYYTMRAEKYEVLSRLNHHKRVFRIIGYVPEQAAPELVERLEQVYHAAAEIEPAEEDAPILLRNAHLTEPVEGIVETFALPKSNEIDPTSVMAWFYYVFFGLMLSDAAYGLLIVLGCTFLLRKFRDMESAARKTFRMFRYCGISTLFWGVLFGSYFGDAITVVSETFFHHAVTIPPIWFEPVKDPMKMLMFSFLFGLIHLFTGLGIQLYQCMKAKDYAATFTDCICWFLLVGGGVVYLFHVDMFLTMANISVKLPTVWANIAAVAAGIGALGILLFSARRGNIGKRLAKGAYSLYGVTSWLSDILSYSRLLALGLATGVIATVFNKMGSMFGGGIVGAIIFIVVFLAGHTLNLGVNLLGAYVHTNRLQFVEFFGKFYEGGGRAFRPFAADTKYYQVQDDLLP